MSIDNTQSKAQSISEIMYAIGVCSQVANKMRMHLNGNLLISNEESIEELVTNFNAGALEAAVQHLSTLADTHATWIEKNSPDQQAKK